MLGPSDALDMGITGLDTLYWLSSASALMSLWSPDSEPCWHRGCMTTACMTATTSTTTAITTTAATAATAPPPLSLLLMVLLLLLFIDIYCCEVN